MSSPLAVVKVGGDVVADDDQRRGLVDNVKGLRAEGWDVVILHGGGPQVNALQERLGLTPRKVGGRRITSPDDLVVVHQVICGQVNVALTSALLDDDVPAFGMHGASGRAIVAIKRPPRQVSGADAPVDFGEVGDVVSVNAQLLRALLDAGQVPVIATLGVEADSGRTFNINADTTVVRVAEALRAELLLMTTAVGAIFRDLDDESSRIAEVDEAGARALIAEGIIVGGMIPKVEEALAVLGAVRAIAIVNGAMAGSFAAAARGDAAVGTRIVSSERE